MNNTSDEIKRLQSCISDLISVLALPALWSGREPSDIAGTLLDVLLTMLRLAGMPRYAAEFKSLIPGARFAIFEKSGHFPYMEEPDETLDVLRDFLRR